MSQVYTVERCTGRGFLVQAGDTFRVRMAEGKQVGDIAFVNAQNHQDGWSDIVTTQFNGQSISRVREILSGPPNYTHLMTVVHDRLGVNFLQGRCSSKMYEFHHGQTGMLGCHENIVAGFAEIGVEESHVPYGTFNVFMNIDYKADGSYAFDTPVAEPGEYVDFLAEIDVAVSISACPYRSVVNDNSPKSLEVEILDGGGR